MADGRIRGSEKPEMTFLVPSQSPDSEGFPILCGPIGPIRPHYLLQSKLRRYARIFLGLRQLRPTGPWLENHVTRHDRIADWMDLPANADGPMDGRDPGFWVWAADAGDMRGGRGSLFYFRAVFRFTPR